MKTKNEAFLTKLASDQVYKFQFVTKLENKNFKFYCEAFFGMWWSNKNHIHLFICYLERYCNLHEAESQLWPRPLQQRREQGKTANQLTKLPQLTLTLTLISRDFLLNILDHWPRLSCSKAMQEKHDSFSKKLYKHIFVGVTLNQFINIM